MSRKLVIEDGRSERELLVVGTVVVGRDPECEISSSDPRLSRRHAELRATPTGVVVRDLGSRNGVRVNGTPITEAVLSAGDVVSVAHLSLRLVDQAAATPAPRSAVTAAMVVTAPSEDDRTRVVTPRGAKAPIAARPAWPIGDGSPTDLGDIIIREAPGDDARPVDVVEPPGDLGPRSLVGVGWGRRVLLQGVLLALVVFLVTVIPIVAWEARAFGVSALSAWAVLLPPLAASVLAGAMGAGLVARTAVRGARRDGRR